MTYTPTELLTVYLDAGARRKVGRFALSDRRILFEYDAAFIRWGDDQRLEITERWASHR